MTCLRCELIRAKARAHILYALGKSFQEIAHELNDHYEGAYVWTQTRTAMGGCITKVERLQPVPPFVPYLVIEGFEAWLNES